MQQKPALAAPPGATAPTPQPLSDSPSVESETSTEPGTIENPIIIDGNDEAAQQRAADLSRTTGVYHGVMTQWGPITCGDPAPATTATFIAPRQTRVRRPPTHRRGRRTSRRAAARRRGSRRCATPSRSPDDDSGEAGEPPAAPSHEGGAA